MMSESAGMVEAEFAPGVVEVQAGAGVVVSANLAGRGRAWSCVWSGVWSRSGSMELGMSSGWSRSGRLLV